MTSPGALKAILYTRISVTREQSTSLTGQADDLVALASAEGWDVVQIFADDGVSGAKQRANAKRALKMLKKGEADVLAVYAYDRWSRQGLEEVAPLLSVLRKRRRAADRGLGTAARFVAQREGLDSSEGKPSEFELRLGIAASLAKAEHERIRSRVVASVDRLRKAGRFAGGTPGFGYRSAPHPSSAGRTLVVVDDEADIVREVAERIVDGESLVAIAADLTDRGVPRSRSPYRLATLRDQEPVDGDGAELSRGTWEQSRVRDLWLSEHLLGRVIVNGAAVVRDGVPIQPFPAILDLETHLKIKARFDGVKRGQQRRKRASHLFSGFVYCAGCEGRMYPRSSREDIYFGCSASARGRACPLGHPRIKAAIIEERVVGLLLQRFGELPEIVREEIAATDTAARLGDVRARLSETAMRLRDRSADRTSLLAELDALQDEQTRLENLPDERLVRHRATGRTLAQAWSNADLDGRRRILGGWVDCVTIGAAASRGRTIDYSRISIGWTPDSEAV